MLSEGGDGTNVKGNEDPKALKIYSSTRTTTSQVAFSFPQIQSENTFQNKCRLSSPWLSSQSPSLHSSIQRSTWVVSSIGSPQVPGSQHKKIKNSTWNTLISQQQELHCTAELCDSFFQKKWTIIFILRQYYCQENIMTNRTNHLNTAVATPVTQNSRTEYFKYFTRSQERLPAIFERKKNWDAIQHTIPHIHTTCSKETSASRKKKEAKIKQSALKIAKEELEQSLSFPLRYLVSCDCSIQLHTAHDYMFCAPGEHAYMHLATSRSTKPVMLLKTLTSTRMKAKWNKRVSQPAIKGN